MFKNEVEWKSSLFANNDVVQNPEQQSRKKNSNEKSHSTDSCNVFTHASEALRHDIGVRMEKNFEQVDMFGLEVCLLV